MSGPGVALAPPRPSEWTPALGRPALAVKWTGAMRVGDGDGVLLPSKTATSGLPVYEKKTSPPQGPEGTRWGDADLEQFARKLRMEKR